MVLYGGVDHRIPVIPVPMFAAVVFRFLIDAKFGRDAESTFETLR